MNKRIRAAKDMRNVGLTFGIASAMICVASESYAQTALRTSLAGQDAAEARKRDIENERYNIKLGPVSIWTQAALGAEYNDNVNFADVGREEDYIIRPQANLGATWLVSQANRLSLNLGVGYAKYINNDELDHFYVNPLGQNELAFDLYVGDVWINFHDRFQATQEAVSELSLSAGGFAGDSVAAYGRIENTAGVLVTWDLNQLILRFGYDHYNFWATRSAFERLDRSSELFTASSGFKVNPNFVVGVDVAGGWTDYDRSVLNDNYHISVGPFIELRLTPNLDIRLGGGYIMHEFESSGSIGDTEDASTGYADVTINHRLNKSFSHAFSAGRQVQLGTASNFYEVYYVRENIRWHFIRNVALKIPLFYEHAEESATPLGAERINRYGVGIGFDYLLMERLVASVAYQFILRDSNLPFRDYCQNRVTLDFAYRF